MTVKEFCRYEETIKIKTHIIIRNIRETGYCLYDGAYSYMPNTIFTLRACKVVYYKDVIEIYVDEEISCIADEAFDNLLISLIYKLYDERIKRADVMLFGYRVIMKDGSKYYIDREFFVDELISSIGIRK
jgi:hypothetical protein